MKCDRLSPCGPCVKHGVGHRCTLEVVDLSTRWTKSRDEQAFLLKLQSTLSSTSQSSRQESLTLVEQRLNVLRTGHPTPVDRASSSPGAPTAASGKEFRDMLNDQNDEDFETALTLMRLGRGYPDSIYPHADTILADWPESLPEPEITTTLVAFYLENLSWHHNVLSSVEFGSQCVRFCTMKSIISTQWLSLLFSVLAVSPAASYPFFQGALCFSLSESQHSHSLMTIFRQRLGIFPKVLPGIYFLKVRYCFLPKTTDRPSPFNNILEHLREEASVWYNQAMALLSYSDYAANHSGETSYYRKYS